MDKNRLEASKKSNTDLADFLRRHIQGAGFSTWTQANLIEIIRRLESKPGTKYSVNLELPSILGAA